MSATDRGHVAEASPTVTIIWKPGLNLNLNTKNMLRYALQNSFKIINILVARFFQRDRCSTRNVYFFDFGFRILKVPEYLNAMF